MSRPTRHGRGTVAGLALLLLALCLSLLLPAGAAAAEPAARYIVQLADGARSGAVIDNLRARLGVRPAGRFGHVLNGFSTSLTPAQRAAVAADPNVVAVVPDMPIEAAYVPNPNEVQPGIVRVGATANADRDVELDVDIAILDTGVQPDNPELNVVGGYNCTDPSKPGAWADGTDFGHGTHVSGIAAAKQNGSGVAGVAQGARLWAIKVLTAKGAGLWSWVICGLDHVAAMQDADGEQTIEVVNMSISGGGWDDGDCGRTNADPLHQAVCRLNEAGVTMVVAAGNDKHDAKNNIPGAYDEVITVSAMSYWHTQPRPPAEDDTGELCSYKDPDNSFAKGFSNFGADVDLIAPGECVWSLRPNNRLEMMTGTSMATPHVAGGAALYYVAEAKAGRPRPTPQQVRAALVARGTLDWLTSTDPDIGKPGGAREPALQVSEFDSLQPAFSLGTDRQIVRLAAGSETDIGVWIARIGGFDGEVDLALDSATLPSGASATFSGSAATSGTNAVIHVAAPADVSRGTFNVRINGSADGKLASTTFTLVVFGTGVDGDGPRMQIRSGVAAGKILIPVQLKWTKVGGAAKYRVEQSVDGSAWAKVAKTLKPKLNISVRPGQRYQFRVRAKIAGIWDAWHEGPSSVVSVIEPGGDIQLHGDWTSKSIKKAYSELVVYSHDPAATATLQFDGRSVGWIASTGKQRGKAWVNIDGAAIQKVNLYSSKTKHRRLLFSKHWDSSGSHTLRIDVLGKPAGHPRVDLDALVIVSE